MLEKDIERHLRDGVRNMGGWCLKLVCPGFTGVPDRMILLPGGMMAFVETKRPGQKERQRQAFVQSRLRKMGFRVFSSVGSWAKVDDVLCWCAAVMAGVEEDGGPHPSAPKALPPSPEGKAFGETTRGKAFGRTTKGKAGRAGDEV